MPLRAAGHDTQPMVDDRRSDVRALRRGLGGARVSQRYRVEPVDAADAQAMTWRIDDPQMLTVAPIARRYRSIEEPGRCVISLLYVAADPDADAFVVRSAAIDLVDDEVDDVDGRELRPRTVQRVCLQGPVVIDGQPVRYTSISAAAGALPGLLARSSAPA